MIYRTAEVNDIPQLQVIRNSVKENVLSDPSMVKDADYIPYLTINGKGWVGMHQSQIVGFAIADLKTHNVWALFVKPEYEKKGIGTQLHHLMLNWYFNQTTQTIWLSTAFNTRAENFYRKLGWTENGAYGTKEIKFIMPFENWSRLNLT